MSPTDKDDDRCSSCIHMKNKHYVSYDGQESGCAYRHRTGVICLCKGYRERKEEQWALLV